MKLNYEYTLEDIREVYKLSGKYRPHPDHTRRAIARWVVFTVLLLALVFLLNTDASGPAPALNKHVLMQLLPWVLASSFVFYFLYRIFRPSTAMLKQNPVFQKPIVLDLDETGIAASDGPTYTRRQWEAFDMFIETERSFALRVTNSRQCLMLPKRAIDNPAGMDAVRHLLQTSVQGSTGAFPVLPLATADVTEQN